MAAKKFAIALVEGETEKSLLNDFKNSLKYPIKRIVKVNLWNSDIKKIAPSFTEPSDILVIFDTDILDNLDRFQENLKILTSRKHTIFLFQQKNNFEDEIAHASSLSKKKLFAEFCPKGPSADNFKHEFNRIDGRLRKLTALGLDKDRLWERELIEQLHRYNEHSSSHRKYFSVK